MEITVHINPHADTLEQWISAGKLNTQHWNVPNPDCRPEKPCIECELSQRLIHVATGMLALAQVDTDSRFVQEARPEYGTPAYPCSRNSRILSASWRGAHCTSADISYWSDFKHGGSWGLNRLTLEVSQLAASESPARLGLALPLSNCGWSDPRPDGYTVLTVDSHGAIKAYRYGAMLHDDGFLSYSLGLSVRPVTITALPANLSLDELVFPDVAEKLPQALLRLHTFLTELSRSIEVNRTRVF